MRIGILTALLFFYSPLIGRQIDSFYIRLFNEGESAFLSRNYQECVRALEIAIFGLNAEKKYISKAYVYLGVSCYYLKDIDKSRQYLERLAKLMGEDGLESLELQEATLLNLQKLLDEHNLRRPSGGPVSEPSLLAPPLPLAQFGVPRENLPRNPQMERQLGTNPDNPSHYYGLYSLYIMKKELKSAKRVLQELIRKRPAEANAFYLLGKLEFGQKKHESVLGYLNAVLDPAFWGQLDDESKVKTIILIALSLDNLKLNQNVSFFLEYLQKAAPEDMIQRMLKEEGLEAAWRALKAAVLKSGSQLAAFAPSDRSSSSGSETGGRHRPPEQI